MLINLFTFPGAKKSASSRDLTHGHCHDGAEKRNGGPNFRSSLKMLLVGLYNNTICLIFFKLLRMLTHFNRGSRRVNMDLILAFSPKAHDLPN